MSSLSTLRNQLSAIENIKKITTSMEMVASARFRRAQDKAKQAQFYIAKMDEILEKLNSASTDFIHPLFIQRPIEKIKLVIVSSDRGLCGAYNTAIFSAADQFLSTHKNVELSLLGKKAIQYYQHKQWNIQSQLTDWGGKITFQQIKELSEELIKSFLSKSVDSIWLVYTKFFHLMHREVVLEQFLPLGKTKKKDKNSLNYIFEPDIEEIYESLLPHYCMTKIETMVNQAYASELIARIFAMKAAAKNAEEMMEHLTLERNKVRQTGITRELLETTAL